jgi:ATP-dependent DNA ligase
MMQSRASRKKQRGYKDSIEEAIASDFKTSGDGFPLPMLALRIEKVRLPHSQRTMWIQPKLNGHRCGILKTSDGEMIARSRLGNRITTIEPLLEALKPSMPDDLMVDGELYVHGWKLQTIGSAVKRQSDLTQHLTFQTYDVADMELGYGERLDELKKIIKPAWSINPNINIVQTTEVGNVGWAWDFFKRYKTAGYEGAMLRLGGVAYQPGHRSSALLKMKQQMDAEFKILSVQLSSRGIPVCTLEAPNGKPFDCTAPGSDSEKMQVYHDQPIGKMMTCEFAEWTEDGLPFHCVALQVREDV